MQLVIQKKNFVKGVMMNTCRRFSENDVEDPDDARNKVTDKRSSKHSNNGWGSVHQCDRLCWWKLSRKVILGGDQNSAEEEKKRHDLALEKYQAAYEKYQEYRIKLLGWIATYYRVKEKAKYNFVDTDYAMKLYNNQDLDLREPKLSDFYKPSTSQKQGEMIYVGGIALAL